MLNIGKIARLVQGMILMIFSLHGFTGFMSGRVIHVDAEAFLNSVDAVSFVFPALSVIAAVLGIFFLINRGAPIINIASAPLVIMGTLYFIFMDLKGGVAAYVSFAAMAVMFYEYRKAYKILFRNPEENQAK